MRRSCGVKAEGAGEDDGLSSRQRNSVGVALFRQPVCDGRWGVERNVAWELVQRLEGKVIRMRVCEQECVEPGQRIYLQARGSNPRQKAPELGLEVRIRENANAGDL